MWDEDRKKSFRACLLSNPIIAELLTIVFLGNGGATVEACIYMKDPATGKRTTSSLVQLEYSADDVADTLKLVSVSKIARTLARDYKPTGAISMRVTKR